jgi:HK97 family phage portal protein
LEYDYLTDKGTTLTYNSEDIFHVKGLSFDGVKGLSPIAQAREAIGLALSTEEYGAKFFGNGARPGGVIEFPGAMKDPDKVREIWNKTFQGSANSHKVAVLEQGAKFQTVGLPPEESQFLETRKFQINEICRIFRVPPHLVGDLEKATFSNIEHQSIEFVQHTIRPWLVRWEQEIARSLLGDGERGMYFAKFNVDGLLRGDYATRMRGYSIGIQNGFLSPNCVRALEDLEPIPDEKGGNNFFVNGNMKLLNDAETKPDTGNSSQGGDNIGEQKGSPDAADDRIADGEK